MKEEWRDRWTLVSLVKERKESRRTDEVIVRRLVDEDG